MLSRADAASLLARFVAGQLSAKELSEWSNSVEGRDDVGYEPGHESLLIDLIFQLANPEIHHELTTKVAEDWLERLRAG